MFARILLFFVLCSYYGSLAEVDLITEPRPGEEYVLVSSGRETPVRSFETAHKIPEKHPQHRIFTEQNENGKITKKLYSGKSSIKQPSEGIVSIEEDKKVLLKKGHKSKISESVEIDLPVSKIEDIKIKADVKSENTLPNVHVDLETMSDTGKLSSLSGTTTQKPTLTTGPPSTTQGFEYIPINFDSIDDINTGLLSSNVKLETAGSEQKQHSRIQIKKGPNGQDYEYEYIYYYYDDDENNNKTKTSVHNSHDGPQKVEAENQISNERTRSKYNSIDRSSSNVATTPSADNEVLPSTKSRHRGRNIDPAPVQEDQYEDRLPSSTRFPPRGRNLATTYIPEVTSESSKQRGRPQHDNTPDESTGQSRSRTRAHIRRPSSELVDLDSFKTGDVPNQHKDLPSRYSAEIKTTTDSIETPTTLRDVNTKDTTRDGHKIASSLNFQEISDESKLPAGYKTTTTFEQDTTEYTTMTAMEKVALDLYAYLAGENLNNEVNPTASDYLSYDVSTTTEFEASTTDYLTTTDEVTTTTSTTTTTTTTPAPTTTTTTTTTPAPSTRPSRFKLRGAAKGRASTTTSTTEVPQETSIKTKGRFGKPRLNGRKTTPSGSPSESSTTTNAPGAEKAVTQTKTSFGRRGLFAGRTRPAPVVTSPTPPQSDSNAAPNETPAPTRVILRPGLRRLSTSTTTAAPSEDSAPSAPSAPADTGSETTAAPSRTIGGRPGLRPLRPGARLNLRVNPRLRPGIASSAPVSESVSEISADTAATEAPATEADSEGSSTAATEAPRGGIRLRNRLIVPSPKPRVAVTQPPRRPNPLLKRKQLTTEATTEAKPKEEEEIETSDEEEKTVTETEEVPAETTAAPPLRGLDALYARRRAAQGNAVRPPIRTSRRA